MNEIKWSDKLLSGNRTPRLFVVPLDGSPAVEFKGESLPGLLVVLSARHEKNGKWSGYDYVLAHNPEKSAVLPIARRLHADAVFEDVSSLAAMRERAKWPPEALDAVFTAFLESFYGMELSRHRACGAALEALL